MITRDILRRHQILGCQFIQDAGSMNKLPQVVVISGQSIFHRFFYKQSIAQFDVFTVAMGSFLLAGKAEEKILALKEVIVTFHYLYFQSREKRRKELEIGSELYLRWKSQLLSIEKEILSTLGFAVYEAIDHPHQYLLYIIKLITPSAAFQPTQSDQSREDRIESELQLRVRELAQKSWNFLNDSMRIDLELRFHSTCIACAAIFLASRQLQYPLPEAPDPWWTILFHVDSESVYEVSDEILSLYTLGKVKWIQPFIDSEYLSLTIPL